MAPKDEETYRPSGSQRRAAQRRIATRATHTMNGEPSQHDQVEPQQETHLIVGIDYGTTFTSVVFCNPLTGEIIPVRGWSVNARYKNLTEVPTELIYLRKTSIRPRVMSDDDDNDDEDQDGHICSTIFGYDATEPSTIIGEDRDPANHVRLSKLLLLISPAFVGPYQTPLRKQVKRLQIEGIIQKECDLHRDILIKVLSHANDFARRHLNYKPSTPIKFSISVPTAWTQAASRTLQSALEEAIRYTKFGILENCRVPDLFIIHEAEAAVAYMLADKTTLKLGAVFTLIDAGGGTVDTVTYVVRGLKPLRLEREAVVPKGDDCGSTYLNQNYSMHLRNRLKDEKYLEEMLGGSFDTMISRLMPQFEDIDKRKIDIFMETGTRGIYIPGLRECATKRFKQNHLTMNKNDWHSIYMPLLRRVRALMMDQLTQCFELRLEPKAVFLTGGFGASPSLQTYLRSWLDRVSKEKNYAITLFADSDNSTINVAAGAALSYLYKDNGPERIAQSSFGFLQKQAKTLGIDGHDVEEGYLNERDGQYYIKAVDYFVVVGETIAPNKKWGPFPYIHLFEKNEPRLICEELLYVSDTATESDYSINHVKNADVRLAGQIEFDVTEYRVHFEIVWEEHLNGYMIPYHKVELDLMIEVDGRNMKYWATLKGLNERSNLSQVSLAAAFHPGTK